MSGKLYRFDRFTMDLDEAVGIAEPHARTAIALDPENADARARLAVVHYLSGNPRGAIYEAEQGLLIDPNCPEAHALRGVGFLGLGQQAEARRSLQRCVALDPRSPTLAVRISQIAEAYYMERDYENAILTAQELLSQFPSSPTAYRCLAAGLAQVGRLEQARAALTMLIANYPSAVETLVRRHHPGRRIEDREHFMEGLRKAGWVE